MTTGTLNPEVRVFLRDAELDLPRDLATYLADVPEYEDKPFYQHPASRMELAGGDLIEFLYAVTVYPTVPLGVHDCPAVREFLAECLDLRQAHERYADSPESYLEYWGRRALKRRARSINQDEASLEIEARERIRAKLEAKGISPGQETLRGSFPVEKTTPQNSSTWADSEDSARLNNPREMEKKIEAEGNLHRLSLDWTKNGLSPSDYKIYKKIGEKLMAGERFAEDIPWLVRLDPTGRIRKALLSSRYLLGKDAEGFLHLMSDRATYVEEDWGWYNGVKVNLAKLPGHDPSINPLAGKNWTAGLVDDVVMLGMTMLTERGKRPSYRDVARWWNELDIKPYKGLKPLSEDQVAKSMKRLRRRGDVVVIEKAEYYRRNHAWACTPAKYELAANVPMLANKMLTPDDVGKLLKRPDLVQAA